MLSSTFFYRYLFNAGEGFQRFCVEHKIKMNRVSSCLVTRLTGDATGGLPGTSLIEVSAPDHGLIRPILRPCQELGMTLLLNAALSPTALTVKSDSSHPGAIGMKYVRWPNLPRRCISEAKQDRLVR